MSIPPYHVVLTNLSRDARCASVDFPSTDLGRIHTDELLSILTAFTAIDALENTKADPEIRVHTRKDRFIVRTGQRKLFLQDARRPEEPAFTVTPEELLAELDGTAAARRTAPPVAAEISPEHTLGAESAPETVPYVAPDEPTAPSRPWILGAFVALMAGYLGYTEITAAHTQRPSDFAALTSAERLAEDAALVGVYATGSDPGQNGIIILGDGRLKLYQNYATAAPGVIAGSYRLARSAGKVCLDTDQPGGVIVVQDRNSLEFCGEVFKRIP